MYVCMYICMYVCICIRMYDLGLDEANKHENGLDEAMEQLLVYVSVEEERFTNHGGTMTKKNVSEAIKRCPRTYLKDLGLTV